MRAIKTILLTTIFVVCFVNVSAQYQRKRVPTERTMNDSIVVGKTYEYKLYGDIDGTRRTTVRVDFIKNDSVWYWMDGHKQIKSYKNLAKWLVLE